MPKPNSVLNVDHEKRRILRRRSQTQKTQVCASRRMKPKQANEVMGKLLKKAIITTGDLNRKFLIKKGKKQAGIGFDRGKVSFHLLKQMTHSNL